jgi:hypothetical protein
MKLKPSLEKKSFIAIFIVVVALLIFCIALFLSGFLQENENYEDEEVIKNMTPEELNETIIAELKQMVLRHMVTKWEIDDEQKYITIYEVGMTDDQIAELEKKKIGGWNVSVQSDIDYINEKEAAMAEIMELKKDPELQISGFMSDADYEGKAFIIWVYNRTPENEALDGKVIYGWKIRIAGPGYKPGYVSTENK